MGEIQAQQNTHNFMIKLFIKSARKIRQKKSPQWFKFVNHWGDFLFANSITVFTKG
jgi:hypothetical protein